MRKGEQSGEGCTMDNSAASRLCPPTVIHSVFVFLNRTENWIYNQMRFNTEWNHLVLCCVQANEDEFPWPHVSARPRFRRSLARYSLKLGRRYSARETAILSDQLRPRLIHAHFGWEGYRNLPVKQALRLPLLTTFYGLDATRLGRKCYWRRRFRQLFERGDLFLVEGPVLRDRLAELGCPVDRVRVHHFGIDLERVPFRPRNPEEAETPRILMVGRFTEKKGHIYALEAFGRISAEWPRAVLEFVGDGRLLGAVKARVPTDIRERVRFHTSCSYSRYAEILERATILLAPSVTASDGDSEGGAPVTVLEAMAAGLPLVATRHADIPNLVPPAWRGELVPERDPDSLAGALRAKLRSPSSWPRVASEGRTWVEQNFDTRKRSRVLGEIYRSLT